MFDHINLIIDGTSFLSTKPQSHYCAHTHKKIEWKLNFYLLYIFWYSFNLVNQKNIYLFENIVNFKFS